MYGMFSSGFSLFFSGIYLLVYGENVDYVIRIVEYFINFFFLSLGKLFQLQ